MSANLKSKLNMGMVYVLLGLIMGIASIAVGYVVVFAEPAVMPLGDVGRFILVVVLLGVNGALIVWIASIRGRITKIVPTI